MNTENLHQMIGARIKLLRIEREKYQKDVADALTKDGIYLTEAQLLTYEKGKRKASSDVIIGLAKYFNVSTDYILCLTDNPGNTLFENSSITNLKLKKGFAEISDKDIKKIQVLLDLIKNNKI